MKRKLGILVLVLVMVLSVFSGCSEGAAYPAEDVTIIVPYGAGGTTDLTTRGLLDAISEDTKTDGMNFLISNVAGGSGLIGATQFANSDPDGYTLGIVNCDLVLNGFLGNTDISVDQFVPLVALQADPYAVLVSKDSPFNTFEELIDYVLAHPGEVALGDTGIGTTTHLAEVAMNKFIGTDFKSIAYDSSADSVIAVVSGEVTATITHTSAATGQLDAGAVRMLAVTSNERLSTYPDVPSIGELYEEAADMQILSWILVAASKDVDADSIAYLQDTFGKAVQSDKFKNTIKNFYMQEISMDSAQMDTFIQGQHDYYAKLFE